MNGKLTKIKLLSFVEWLKMEITICAGIKCCGVCDYTNWCMQFNSISEENFGSKKNVSIFEGKIRSDRIINGFIIWSIDGNYALESRWKSMDFLLNFDTFFFLQYN